MKVANSKKKFAPAPDEALNLFKQLEEQHARLD
jgi:hypothetical protein